MEEVFVCSLSRLPRSAVVAWKIFHISPTKMSLELDDKWQTTRPTIRSRSKFMFNNELLSDVSFVVSVQLHDSENKKCKKVIHAHKFVLAISSPVFFSMFFGDLAETSHSIALPDCEYDSLLELFRFLYCDEVRLNEDNVMQVLYLAKKYIVPSLAERCTEFLEKVVSISNVFCVMTHAESYGEQALVEQCWRMIDRQTEAVVKTEGFKTIGRSLLEALVVRDTLNIKEVDLFKAVDKWATNECERLRLMADGTMKRSVLGDKVVQAIRFPVMARGDFNKCVLSCKILTPQEAFSMVEYYNSVSSSPVEFSQVKRSGLHQRCSRFQSVVLERGVSFQSYRRDCIYISVDRDITLHGVCLFGSQNRVYSATLTLKDSISHSVVASKTGDYTSSQMELGEGEITGSFYGFDVHFDSPVSIKKGIWYHLKACIDGPIIWHGRSGVFSMQCPGVKFSFKSHRGHFPTNVSQGQFPQFLFSFE
ncbi:BTB/POZ domain-containing protein 6-like [Montipora capricornis]|uniref:BTB/POZ domain-containing protein 6-like n=1 Tax=Montipora capricornis TaxID=246305 RepID=UPI0035F12FD8